MSADRTVHGKGIDDQGRIYEVARYDRAGKWYQEFPHEDAPRRLIAMRSAVRLAEVAYLGRPGGRQFDRLWEAK